MTHTFTIHKQSGIALLLQVLAGLSVVEAGAIHLLVQRWSSPVAWVLTALSLYAAVWLLGLARSFSLRPILVDAEGVTLQWGSLWTLRVPADAIAKISRSACDRRTPGYLGFAPLTDATFLITPRCALTAEGPWGIRRQVTCAGLAPDDAQGFEAACRQFGYVT